MFDREDDRLATPTEACREYARNVGAEQPDRAWILTDYDTWEQNPFYVGPPAPHPEDEQQGDPDFDGEGIDCPEDDGQPTEYEEWQDFMGGDDWDHGQFDGDY